MDFQFVLENMKLDHRNYLIPIWKMSFEEIIEIDDRLEKRQPKKVRDKDMVYDPNFTG